MSLVEPAAEGPLVLALRDHPARRRLAAEALGIKKNAVGDEPRVSFQGLEVEPALLGIGVIDDRGQGRGGRARVAEIDIALGIPAEVDPVAGLVDLGVMASR